VILAGPTWPLSIRSWIALPTCSSLSVMIAAKNWS
jgi:hypothetical protein